VTTFTITIDPRRFGPAQVIIGNTLHDHKPTRWSRWKSWWHYKRTGHGGALKCRACDGGVGVGECFEYHQADAVIAAMEKWL